MNHSHQPIRHACTSATGLRTVLALSPVRSGRPHPPCHGHPDAIAPRALGLAVALCFAAASHALPQGGTVAAGQATVTAGPVAGSMVVRQSSPKASINWQSFNIASGEGVRFIQPDASAVILNRVLGADPSRIFGELSANGQVFLLNPNGVLFGAGAQVNVGALVATTLNLSDADFLAGRYRFVAGNGAASVTNQGTLTADGGYVALLGATVANDGTIVTRRGSTALAAGQALTLDVLGDGLLQVTVEQGAVNALVRNGGLIQSDGGQVLLTTQAAGSLLPSVVNNTGVIQAQTIASHQGTILLLAGMHDGSVQVGGRLDASAPAGGHGGFIETSAGHVSIAPDAVITALAPLGKTGVWLLDPTNWVIALAGDETPASVTTSLATTNRVIVADNDITVADAVTWTTAQNLELRAGNDVLLNAAVTGTNGSPLVQAGRDVTVAAAFTTTTGNLTAIAGRNVTVAAASTITTGNMVLHADNDGGGPGVAAGTVLITCGIGCLTITTGVLDIRFNPVTYGSTAGEILAYQDKLTGAGVLDAKAWVYGLGQDKLYDGTTAATVSGLRPDATSVLPPVALGAVTNAVFDAKDVGTNRPITFNSTFAAAAYALFAPWGAPVGTYQARASITPRPLVVTATDQSKPYGTALPFAGSEFTSTGLQGADTINSVTLVSPGSPATAPVSGSPYAITPSAATGTFIPGNYLLSYVNGALTVTPVPLAVTALDQTKTAGSPFVFAGTEFTSAGLVTGDTIGAVTLTSPGAATGATAVGSPYAITPSAATGGSFVPTNYVITYNDAAGGFTVTPVILPPVVVVPPPVVVELPPVVVVETPIVLEPLPTLVVVPAGALLTPTEPPPLGGRDPAVFLRPFAPTLQVPEPQRPMPVDRVADAPLTPVPVPVPVTPVAVVPPAVAPPPPAVAPATVAPAYVPPAYVPPRFPAKPDRN